MNIMVSFYNLFGFKTLCEWTTLQESFGGDYKPRNMSNNPLCAYQVQKNIRVNKGNREHAVARSPKI
jgi:long-subunit fatty acid transport protein